MTRSSSVMPLKRTLTGGAIDCELVGDCENGKQAAEFVKEYPVDIVLTDILMPYMDGMELQPFFCMIIIRNC